MMMWQHLPGLHKPSG